MHSIIDKVTTKVLLVLVFLSATLATNQTVLAESNQQDITADVAVRLLLNDTTSTLEFDLQLHNRSVDKVITKYNFPNLWRITSLLRDKSNLPAKHRLEITPKELSLDTALDPLTPGKSVSLKLYLVSNVLQSQFGQRFASFGAYDASESQGLKTNLTGYAIQYPLDWGRPDILDFSGMEAVTSVKEEKFINLDIPRIVAGKIQWNDSMSAILSIPLTQQHTPILRDVQQHKVQATNASQVDINIDNDGNLYVSGSGSWNVGVEMSQDIKYVPPDRSELKYKEYPVPNNLRDQIRSLSAEAQQISSRDSQKVSWLVSRIIDLISKSYSVNELSWADFNVSKVLEPSTDKLTYPQYLLDVLTILRQFGFEGNVVFIGTGYTDSNYEFVFEHCTDICSYYSLNWSITDEFSRERSGLGLQLFAFSGINSNLFTRLEQMSLKFYRDYKVQWLPTHSSAVMGESTSTGNRLETYIQLPPETRAFTNFPATVTFNNLTENIVFLKTLYIDGQKFPLIEGMELGMYKGLLPGSTNSILVQNIFLDRMVWSDKTALSLPYKLEFLSGTDTQVTMGSINTAIRPNYNFSFVLSVFLVAAGIALVVGASIFTNLYVNKRKQK